jgi:hypothetical protein
MLLMLSTPQKDGILAIYVGVLLTREAEADDDMKKENARVHYETKLVGILIAVVGHAFLIAINSISINGVSRYCNSEEAVVPTGDMRAEARARGPRRQQVGHH